jgi:hypothetical protein
LFIKAATSRPGRIAAGDGEPTVLSLVHRAAGHLHDGADGTAIGPEPGSDHETFTN